MRIYCPNCRNYVEIPKKMKRNAKYFCNHCMKFFEPSILPEIPAFSGSSKIRARRDLYVSTACNELNLTDDVRNEVRNLLDEYGTYQTRGEVAGAVYMVLRDHGIEIKQDSISDVLNVSSVTLRNGRDRLVERMR